MKGDIFTAENPTPAAGKRTSLDGTILPDEWFDNESDEAAVRKSSQVSDKQIRKEAAAIDALLAGDDTLFDQLEY